MALVMERDDILKKTIDKVNKLNASHGIKSNPTEQCVNAFSFNVNVKWIMIMNICPLCRRIVRLKSFTCTALKRS